MSGGPAFSCGKVTPLLIGIPKYRAVLVLDTGFYSRHFFVLAGGTKLENGASLDIEHWTLDVPFPSLRTRDENVQRPTVRPTSDTPSKRMPKVAASILHFAFSTSHFAFRITPPCARMGRMQNDGCNVKNAKWKLCGPPCFLNCSALKMEFRFTLLEGG